MKALTSALADEAAMPSLRRHLLGAWAAPVAIIGFVAGHACLPNSWLHLGWLLLAGLPAIFLIAWTPQLRRWRADAGALSVIAFLSWMLLRSCVQIPFIPGHARDEITQGVVGAVLLLMFCALLWQQAQGRAFLRTMGWVAGATSTFAALISIMLCYFVLPNHHVGERLQNLLVHGGLNPVCTGLIFGFSAVWLAALVDDGSLPLPRRMAWAAIVLLHFAAFLSSSRGAMLAMGCGHAVLLLARGWRRGRAALCVLLLTGTVYFTAMPLLTHAFPGRAAPATAPKPHAIQSALKRGDNGRLDIYRAGWHAMDNLWAGTGQWGVREVWQCEMQARANIDLMSHLHSAFFATFVHGGIVGLVLLLTMLGCGIRRACRLAVQGDATWIALLAFGCAGLLFDGESLASLATAPRFEGLLFWLPLVVALARGSANSPRAGS